MDGILIIKKEKGFTSHDVVAKLRGILRQKKIGHTGTLDPDAVGVLPVCLGKGTKVVELLTDREKTYRTRMQLGITTDTQDISGQVLRERPVTVTEEEVLTAAKAFLGEQLQIPPMYSALKVNGQKLCDLARKGIEVERKPRPITFLDIQVLSLALPYVELEITCSKGTYIRTFCHDLGEALGCGACMTELTRTRAGRFSLEDALTLSEVEALRDSGEIESRILPIESVFQEYPRKNCTEEGERLLKNGNPLSAAFIPGEIIFTPIRLCDSHGTFLGLYQWKPNRQLYFPLKMF